MLDDFIYWLGQTGPFISAPIYFSVGICCGLVGLGWGYYCGKRERLPIYETLDVGITSKRKDFNDLFYHLIATFAEGYRPKIGFGEELARHANHLSHQYRWPQASESIMKSWPISYCMAEFSQCAEQLDILIKIYNLALYDTEASAKAAERHLRGKTFMGEKLSDDSLT